MPVPAKSDPVQHIYTTNDTEKAQLTSPVASKCFNFDGIEGYVAPWNFGGLVELFRIYNPTVDSYMLATSAKLAVAISNGFNQGQTSLGWVAPN